jgi:hypothetical protein
MPSEFSHQGIRGGPGLWGPRVEDLVSERCQNWVPTGWTEKQQRAQVRLTLLRWLYFAFVAKLTQRQVAAADLETPMYRGERQMLVQSHLWPPVPCRCKTVLICSWGCYLGSRHGSEVFLRRSIKQRRNFAHTGCYKAVTKYISDFQPFCTGYLLKTQP